MSHSLPDPHTPGQPVTALAPMQDVTTVDFMRLIAEFGAPDYYFTEYFRVHVHSSLEKHIVASILQHGTNRPVFAQMIGEDVTELRRTARDLSRLPVAGIDLNMGCPAPKIYKKNAGGGLLRNPDHVERVLASLREEIDGRFTVKMRIGFEDTGTFEEIVCLLRAYEIDLVSIHGRTVAEGYRGAVHYDFIRDAAGELDCPVLANGNILCPEMAKDVLTYTGAAGVMMGRHAIRNPWIFRQTREHLANQPYFRPLLADVRHYVDRLYEVTHSPGIPEFAHISRMKKFLNFIGLGVDPDGAFLRKMRRAQTAPELFAACDAFMIDNGRNTIPFARQPHTGLVARPNCESPHGTSCSRNKQGFTPGRKAIPRP